MHPGTIAYFPEGTHYGPQDNHASSLTLVMQFGGASGSGYISTEQYETARSELSRTGSFNKGVYSRVKEDGGKINKDAYEAVWEQVNGRELVYPKQRYSRPVFMEPENFEWVPHDGPGPGVCRKILGVFSECRIRIAQYRVGEGRSMRLEDNAIYFVEHGAGSVDDVKFGKHSSIYLKEGENAVLNATAATELLQLGLPYFS